MVPIGLDGVLSEEEKKLYNIISSSSSSGLDELDGGERIPEEFSLLFKPDAEETVDQTEANDASFASGGVDFFTSPPLIVLGLSCIAALLAVGCIAVALYATRVIRKHLLGSATAWDILPRLEQQGLLDQPTSDVQGPPSGGDRNGSAAEKRSLPEPAVAHNEPINEKVQLIILDSDSDSESDSDDEFDEKDEKFHDAEFFDIEERPLSALDIRSDLLPQIVIDLNEEFPDPDLLPLPQFSTPFSTPPPSPPRTPLLLPTQMRETSVTPIIASPLSKPAWSLRAADAPALGLASSTTSSRSSTPRPTLSRQPSRSVLRAPTPSIEHLSIPGALYPDPPLVSAEPEMREVEIPGRRRAYRAPVPELDIAFAMQLRPGLGLGSDPAWLVRFLMAMFGWMTVLIGGNPGANRVRRAIA